MALNVLYVKEITGFSPVHAQSYVLVFSVTATKEKGVANVVFYNLDKSIVLNSQQYPFEVSVDDNAKNFIKQAYNHLKTLPEFAGAKDC